MAKGESNYSSQGKSVVRFENKPIPEDDYGLVLLAEGLEVRRSKDKGADAIPYISCRFTTQGTASKEGGKDRIVFQNFFLSTKPGSDGVIMPERGGGIVEFFRAHGEELDVPVLTLEKEDGSVEAYLDPEPLLEKLQEWTDSVTQAHVEVERERDRIDPKTGKVIKANPNAPGRNRINHWLIDSVMTTEAKTEAPRATGTTGKSNVTNLPKKKVK